MSFELMVHAIVALLGGYKDNMSGMEDVKAHEVWMEMLFTP